jgi:cytochrome c biogenesis protein CcmG/thiol:disulfide interchange protein DsbE
MRAWILLPGLLALALAASGAGAGALTPVDEAAFARLVSAHKGKVVLYQFWATWCEPCRAELPEVLKMEARLRGRGFEVVTISADEPEQDGDAQKLLRRFGVPGPAYRKQANDDERFIDAIDPKWSGALPALFLYGRGGRKARSFIGESDMRVVEDAVRKLL